LSFSPNPHWSRSYASQPEILAYIEDRYTRFDFRRKVRCSTPIVALDWQEHRHRWRLRDATGTEYEATMVVSAVGLFNTPAIPPIPGLERFGGRCFHSAAWDHGHDLTGGRVAVVGTGASAIQVVPAIADRVAHLDLYQRTPAWIVPRRDEPYTEEQRAKFETDPAVARRHREELYQFFEQNTPFILGDPIMDAIQARAMSQLEQQVPDPHVRARLTPEYPIGAKRILVSSNFYPALQQEHLELVTDPIREVVPSGIVTADGTQRRCETIVLCTGFRTTEYLNGLRVVGRGGVDIHDWWAGVPRAYRGLAVPGFPNFFMMYGPNTNQGGNSIILMLEAQAQFIASAVGALQSAQSTALEVRADAMDRYQNELHAALANTVWSTGCDSYFRTEAGDIVTQIPYTTSAYAEQTRSIDTADFNWSAVNGCSDDEVREGTCTTS
jgi:cation diffusion facilitator CzcD-associated flavoprotein CzcO